MRILVTGSDGYIGRSLVPLLQARGHDVVGLDSLLFDGCTFGVDSSDVPTIRADVRDVRTEDLEGFDGVVHLAAISNDPLGDLRPDVTYDVNHAGTVRVASAAK
jgi:nucleoside-diphosphate-sugar epimerase